MEAMYLEREKDPNNMFSELDKGLHSLRIGEQCSAIVRYPQLFKTYPFPIMIKSSFVKLANVFRTGTNYIRLCIIQVTQKSSQHLDKISNVGEIVRCIHSVMHSNDPVARALTLNMLGSMVGVLADDKSVQHSIISSLDSNDKIEVQAALFAANAFAHKSKSFSNIVCAKVSEMMDRLWVSVDFKLSVIQVCRSMKCDADTSEKVRNLCLTTLKKYPTVKFVTSVLHTLTIITSNHLIHLDEQIETLLSYLQTDPRAAVRRVVLVDLALLASKLPHIWTEDYVNILLSFSAKDCIDTNTHRLILEVLEKLSSTVAVYLLSNHIADDNSAMLDCVTRACQHDNHHVVLLGLKVFINTSMHRCAEPSVHNGEGGVLKGEMDGGMDELMERLMSTSEMIISTFYEDGDGGELFKEALRSLSSLFKRHSHLTPSLLQHLCFLLDNSAHGEKDTTICEFISSIHSSIHHPNDLHSTLTSQVTSYLQGQPVDVDLTTSQQNFVLSAIRVILQTSRPGSKSDLLTQWSPWLRRLDGWFLYKVSRQASRHAHHDISYPLFKQLTCMATDEGQYSWLCGLEEYSRGEMMMMGCGKRIMNGEEIRMEGNGMVGKEREGKKVLDREDLFDRLMKADELFHKAIVSFKAAASATNQSSFQVSYVTLRSQLCRCLIQVLQASSSYQTLPPPAIASSLALTTGVDSQRCQHILIQLKNCKKKFVSLKKNVTSLYKRSFDADKNTLYHINRYHSMVDFLITTLDKALSFAGSTNDSSLTAVITDTFLNHNKDDVNDDNDDDESVFMNYDDGDDDDVGKEERMWDGWKEIISRSVEELSKGQNAFKSPLSHEVISFLEHVIESCSGLRMCVPRYFFQKLQRTDIKLAITPVMKSAEELIWTRCETGVVLKVEGIVSVFNNIKRLTHKPCSIRLIVKFQIINSYPHIPVSATVPSVSMNNNPLVKDCEIHGDYFSHKFLLAFPTPGTHQVSIEARMVDRRGCVWMSDVRSYLGVQAEAVYKQPQQIQKIK